MQKQKVSQKVLTRYDPKVGSTHTCIVDATVNYTEPETGQVVIFLIHQAIEMNCLNHHITCLMQCFMNGVLINEVSKFLAPVSDEMMHAIQLVNPFDAIHPIIIPIQFHGVTSYMRNPTWEEYKDESILR